MPFLLSHFSPGDKIENCSAQFLAVCWTVHRVNRNEPIGANCRFQFDKRRQLFICPLNETLSVAAMRVRIEIGGRSESARCVEVSRQSISLALAH
jgi:hypothetical protein